MSLRYGLLGLLAEGPASGYDISRRFEDTFSAVWPASHPQIYTELAKLANEKLIQAEATGARGRKAYVITDKGLSAVKIWLTQGPVDHTVRLEFLFRSFFSWLMEPEELKKHLTTEKTFFEARAKEYESYALAKDRGDYGTSPKIESTRVTLEAGARLFRSLAEWAEWAIERANHTESD